MRPATNVRPWRKTLRAEQRGIPTGRRATHQPTPPRTLVTTVKES
jgi:hypothetical protein